MADSLYRNKSSLEVIFRILDKDNSGMVKLSVGQFCNRLHVNGFAMPKHGDDFEMLLKVENEQKIYDIFAPHRTRR